MVYMNTSQLFISNIVSELVLVVYGLWVNISLPDTSTLNTSPPPHCHKGFLGGVYKSVNGLISLF